jgi:hypothetical protein
MIDARPAELPGRHAHLVPSRLPRRAQLLLIVPFSYNRAAQLDCYLRSLLRHILVSDYHVAVVFHRDESHARSYDRLRDYYKDNPLVSFHERSPCARRGRIPCRLLLEPHNTWHYLHHPSMRDSVDDFKSLFESLIAAKDIDLVMMGTDDSLFIRGFDVPDAIANEIRLNPNQASYRLYVGLSSSDLPADVVQSDNGGTWDYYDPRMTSHWAYPFSVDGTVYSARGLLDITRPVLYHNPATLEGYVCGFCKRGRVLGHGYCPPRIAVVTTPLNKVSRDFDNFAGGLPVDYLRDRFEEGYRLTMTVGGSASCSSVIPESLWLEHADRERIDLRVVFPALGLLQRASDREETAIQAC